MEALCRDQYIFRPRGFIRPVFDFHDDSAGFQGADGVPLADGDVQGDYRAAGREFDGLGAATSSDGHKKRLTSIDMNPES